MAQKTLKLLESLMSGHQMTPEELDHLLKERTPEDQFLEYKNGKILKEKKKASEMLREYTSAFANSSGGILIIGVDQETWTVADCIAPGKSSLTEWASSCLTNIISYFSPLPIFQVIKHSDGNVLVIATNRSFGLVPHIKAGKPIYHLRIHDKTIEAPDYLISDLVLGRRQHPTLNITDLSLVNVRSDQSTYPNGWDGVDINFELELKLENEGLSWTDVIRLGLISWIKPNNLAKGTTQLSDYLRSHIKVQHPKNFDFPPVLFHSVKPAHDMEPFTLQTIRIIGCVIPGRVSDKWYNYIWRATIYLISKNSPPIWYQVNLTVNTELIMLADSQDHRLSSNTELIELERLSGERPVVGYDEIHEQIT